MRDIKWYLKQLLPLKYKSKIRSTKDTYRYVTWRMWFGKAFNIKWSD